MARVSSNGSCVLCGRSFSKSGMSRHLKSCREKNSGGEDASGHRPRRGKQGFHLAVEGPLSPGILAAPRDCGRCSTGGAGQFSQAHLAGVLRTSQCFRHRRQKPFPRGQGRVRRPGRPGYGGISGPGSPTGNEVCPRVRFRLHYRTDIAGGLSGQYLGRPQRHSVAGTKRPAGDSVRQMRLPSLEDLHRMHLGRGGFLL